VLDSINEQLVKEERLVVRSTKRVGYLPDILLICVRPKEKRIEG